MTESGLPRVVSIKKLFDEGLGIDETIRLRQGRITGATPEPGTSAAGPLSTAGDSPGLASTPLSGIGPQSPTAGLPAADNGGTITENASPSTAVGSGGSIGNGGGTPPASSGDCEEPDCTPQGGATPVPPSEVRLSQSSVNGAAKIIESMYANGWVGDPVDVVRMPDGGLTSVDNTRVVAAAEAGIDVQAQIQGFDDLLPQEFIDRFTTPKGGAPST